MEIIKVSIILPVYNAEKYLKQCIESIINQTLREIEIIIINDGSLDNSKQIILEYCKKDARIIFIDTENRGVSAARNKGINAAKGACIGFVDADDYLQPDMYERLFVRITAQDADLAICDAVTVQGNKHLKPRLRLKDELLVDKNKEAFISQWLHFKFDFANWNKLYVTGIIRKYAILFNEKLKIWEDLLFNLVYIQKVRRIVTISECLYNYRVHEASVMSASKSGFAKQYNIFYDAFSNHCKGNFMNDQLQVFKTDRSETCVNNIFHYVHLNSAEHAGFFEVCSHFAAELKQLNPEIYSFKEPNGRWFNSFLLRGKMISLFCVLYVAEFSIKKKVRQIIKRPA